jgi:ElaB/YqjD/DUF883 family membrane-anchored ribosome-binding protein
MTGQDAMRQEEESTLSAEEAARTASDRPAEEREKRTPDELRRDIERTRSELGDTVDALAQKADVKAQVSAKADDVKAQVSTKADDVKAQVSTKADDVKAQVSTKADELARTAEQRPIPAIGVALAVGFILGRLLRRR